MRRAVVRAVVVLIALLHGLFPGALAAQSKDGMRRQFLLVRTTSGPSHLSLGIGVTPGDSGGFIGVVAARLEGKTATQLAPVGAFSFGRHDPGAYSPQEKVTTCTTAGLCGTFFQSLGGFMIVELDDEGGPRALNRFFIALEGSDLKPPELEATGWRLVEARFAYRYIDGTDSTAVGASAGAHGAEVFLEAEARGGRAGSIAMAQPPCSVETSNVVGRGVGSARLLGGQIEPSVTCPSVAPAPLIDSATTKTRWWFGGHVVGDSTMEPTRLFVVDLPARSLENGSGGNRAGKKKH